MPLELTIAACTFRLDLFVAPGKEGGPGACRAHRAAWSYCEFACSSVCEFVLQYVMSCDKFAGDQGSSW